MYIKEFIELAIKGGWREKHRPTLFNSSDSSFVCIEYKSDPFQDIEAGDHVFLEEILLDPLAWKAVGKMKGWKEDVMHETCLGPDDDRHQERVVSQAELNSIFFMSDLWRGKTIEDALKTALKNSGIM